MKSRRAWKQTVLALLSIHYCFIGAELAGTVAGGWIAFGRGVAVGVA
jgi:hypothetical protein